MSSSTPLRDHFTLTYFSLRLGIALLGALLPAALLAAALFLEGGDLRGSMSAYYHSPMRDVFVGSLVAIGACLYLYKGFSEAENRALNAAGLLVVGVAYLPTSEEGGPRDLVSTLHGVFAVVFFLCIAYVCLFRAADTLSLIRDTARADRRRALYKGLGGAMIILPAFAVVLSLAFPDGGFADTTTFWVEALAVWVFAAYWVAKSNELRKTDAERLAAQGKLTETEAPSLPAGGRLVQTAVEDAEPVEVRTLAPGASPVG